MGRKAKAWLIGAAVALAGYLGVCGILFAAQRSMIYTPPKVRLDGPPAGSGLQSLDVPVQGLGTIKAWWAPPASRAQPTVIFFHGNGGDRRSFLDFAARLRQHGWGVVLASYSGYSGNPGKPSEAALMADARATLQAVAPSVGPIVVWGHSLGSGVAARMASEGRTAGLVLEAPYTSLTDVAAASDPFVPVRLLLRDRFDTRSLTDRIQVPVLIFHSVDDPEIPFAMGSELAQRLGSRATFERMEGARHYPHSRDISSDVIRWATEHHIGG